MGLKLKANAKINLSLDVTAKRDDGYHEVCMIMQEIGIYDEIEIDIIDSGIELELNNKNIPNDDRNTAYKAARLVIDRFDIKKGVHIKIDKKIPSEAGLAGGSSDAAAVIKGMNELFSLNMSLQDMLDIGKKIGADVPFCIAGGTMLAEGIGEKLTKLSLFKDVNLVVAKPEFGVSTPYIYNKFDNHKLVNRPDTKKLVECIKNNDLLELAGSMYNVLEEVTSDEYKEIADLETMMLENGALGAMMSGSGPTVFGIFEDEQKAVECYRAMEGKAKYLFVTKTI